MKSVTQQKNKILLYYLTTKRPTKFKCAPDDDEEQEELIIPSDAVCIIDIDETGDCVRIWPDLMDLKTKRPLHKINAMKNQSIINQRQSIR